MSFSLPERVILKGPNFIREVFERGVGVPGFISFGIGNPAPEANSCESYRRCLLISSFMTILWVYYNMVRCKGMRD